MPRVCITGRRRRSRETGCGVNEATLVYVTKNLDALRQSSPKPWRSRKSLVLSCSLKPCLLQPCSLVQLLYDHDFQPLRRPLSGLIWAGRLGKSSMSERSQVFQTRLKTPECSTRFLHCVPQHYFSVRLWGSLTSRERAYKLRPCHSKLKTPVGR